MKYFIDTEFLEGAQTEYGYFGWTLKRWATFNSTFFLTAFVLIAWTFNWMAVFGVAYIGYILWYIQSGRANHLFRTAPTIDLISIAIVPEVGGSLYFISKDFNLDEAWNRFQMKQVSGDARNRYPEGVREYWIRENVLKPIWEELIWRAGENIFKEDKMTYAGLKTLLHKYGKTNAEIAEEVKRFCYMEVVRMTSEPPKKGSLCEPVFYGYYADYDWVVFCWLFGKMINLPKGFPMYCRDLKQMYDEWIDGLTNADFLSHWDQERQLTFKEKSDIVRFKNPKYPQQTNEHNALADAKWNMELYKFLQNS